MNIIQQAQAKREALQRDLARIEAFLATAYELQQELGQPVRHNPASDSAKADAPAKRKVSAPTGSGSETVRAVVDILRERGRPLSTRELLPLVQAKGIEVGAGQLCHFMVGIVVMWVNKAFPGGDFVINRIKANTHRDNHRDDGEGIEKCR